MTADSASQTIELEDGRSFVLRPLRRDDLAALRRAFRRLTPEEVEYRFFHRAHELPAFLQAQISHFDPARQAAFVVDDAGEIRAVADLHLGHGDDQEAEFGLIVGQSIAGHGIGRLLLQRLLDEARQRRLPSLCGAVRADNSRMLALCRDLGAQITRVAGEPSELRVVFQA